MYSFDNATNTLTIQEDKNTTTTTTTGKNAKTANYRIIKTPFLKSVQVLSNPNKSAKTNNRNNKKDVSSNNKITFKNAEPKISAVNIDELRTREAEISKQEEKKRQQAAKDRFIESNAKLIGGINGKEIYKKIIKLFPIEEVAVKNGDIVIFDSIKVSKPYEVENIVLLKETHQLERDKRAESSMEFIKNIVGDVNSKIAGG